MYKNTRQRIAKENLIDYAPLQLLNYVDLEQITKEKAASLRKGLNCNGF